jgi:8-oxo-dGTP pyrophosphatase MutT (NUDIX family)
MAADDGFRIVGTRVIAAAPLVRLEDIDLETPGGDTVSRLVVRMSGGVSIVPVVDDEVVLIRQYRTPLDHALIEIPAGKLDRPGEDPEAAARRELAEEVGYEAGSLEQVASFYTSPGYVDEKMTVFVARDLTPVPAERIGPEEVAAEVVRIPIADLPARLAEIEDAKTLVGLMALLANAD